MNLFPSPKKISFSSQEKKSAKILIEKMGLGKKELEQISELYGVSAAQLLDLMRYSKYNFIHEETPAGQCQPCKTQVGKLNTIPFLRKGA